MSDDQKVRAYLVRVGRFYHVRYRLPGALRSLSMSLGVRDKSVAQQKLLAFVAEREREASGIIAPRPLRDAAGRELADHVRDYVADLEGRDLSDMHVYNVRKRLDKLIAGCGWKLLRDVDADSLSTWLSDQTVTSRTKHQYVATLNAFLNWLRRRGRIVANPLLGSFDGPAVVERESNRRALNDDEIRRLLKVSGDRKAVLPGRRDDGSSSIRA